MKTLAQVRDTDVSREALPARSNEPISQRTSDALGFFDRRPLATMRRVRMAQMNNSSLAVQQRARIDMMHSNSGPLSQDGQAPLDVQGLNDKTTQGRTVSPAYAPVAQLGNKGRRYKGNGSGARKRKKNLLNRFKHEIDIDKYIKKQKAKLPATHDTDHSDIKALTGAAGRSEITFSKMTDTSDPADLDNWPDTDEKLNIIREKNDGNVLTRMHQIRGRFGGASAAENMFLGTALSNNFHENSHYAQVESWIEQAMPLAKTSVINYIVEPQFGTIPTYISDRIANSGESDQWQQDMTEWCEQATPSEFKKGRVREGGPVNTVIDADT
jgi:hypothetical protein